MRKLLLALTSLLFASGVALAADVVFLKYDPQKKTLSVKEGDKEVTYKITEKTKLTIIDKDGTAKDAELKLLEKAKEGKTKMEITTDKDVVTEIKTKIGKKSME